MRLEVVRADRADLVAAPALHVERAHLRRAARGRGDKRQAPPVRSRVQHAERLATGAHGPHAARWRHRIDARRALGVGGEQHPTTAPDQRRRCDDREEARLRPDPITGQPTVAAVGDLDEVDEALPEVVLARADERDLRAAGPPGDAAEGNGIARQTPHAPAACRHYAQLRAPGRPLVPPARPVRGERQRLAVRRRGERAMLVVAAR